MAVLFRAGKHIKGYTIVEHLGGGGEGQAYRAMAAGGREVVIKHHVPLASSTPADAHVVKERIKRLERLVGFRCDYVAEVIELFEKGGELYIVTEWIEGRSLKAKLADSGPFAPAEGMCIAHDLLMGLAWLHDANIIHRDIKPDNIVVTDGASSAVSAKVIDLGISLHQDMPRLTIPVPRPGHGPCTPSYASPEQLRGEDVDNRTDLFSLGIVLFELLAGTHPFGVLGGAMSPSYARRWRAPDRPSVRDYLPDFPDSVDNVIQQMLAFEPKDRPATAQEAGSLLQNAATAVGLPVSRPASPGAPTPAPMPIGMPPIPSALPAPPPLPRVAPAVPRAKAFALVPKLRISAGTLSGTELTIPKRGVTLGRAELNPDDDAISRFHIRITSTKDGFIFHDSGSVNGLIYKGKRVRCARLEPGDEVRIGSLTKVVCET